MSKTLRWICVLLQFIASILLGFVVIKMDVLPLLYLIILIVVLVLLFILTFTLMKPSKKEGKGKVKNGLGRILSLLLTISFVFGSFYIFKSDLTLKDITGNKKMISRYSIYVLVDNPAKKLEDLSDTLVQYNAMGDDEEMKEVLKAIKKDKNDIELKERLEFNSLAKDLYNKSTEAILINEAYAGMFEEEHPDFLTETKTIWTYEIVKVEEDISKNVDVTKEPFVIYISGIDTKGKVGTRSRSDVNMMVTVNPLTKTILMTSIPRDYYVTLADKGKKDKLTHSGITGTENTVKTVENFTGLDINYYFRVNFTSVEKIVDALGGIEVNVEKSFSSGVDGTKFTKGKQILKGHKALCYARERHAFGGDQARVRHQQDVLKAMINKAISPAIITNYTKLLDSIKGYFSTNMESNDITKLIKMQLADMSEWTFKQSSMTGKGEMLKGGAYMPDRKLYYMVPKEESVIENVNKIKEVLNDN